MKYEEKGKIKSMVDKLNKKPKKVVMDKPKPTPKPTTKIKTMTKKAGRPASVAKSIYDRTTKDMIKKNIEKILPKGSSKAFEARVKKAYMTKFDSYKVKKGKTEAEHLMNIGRVALQTRNFIEKQIKNGEI